MNSKASGFTNKKQEEEKPFLTSTPDCSKTNNALSKDIEDWDFSVGIFDESLDLNSSGEDKSSCKSGSDQSSKTERRSTGSSTDLSAPSTSSALKKHSRTSYNVNLPSAESQHHLLGLLSDSGFPMTQVNGQRKLGPPPGWSKPPPDPCCEVFVGKIPRNLYEHEIYPIFKRMGEVYEIRLMMDFSGTNRGYCFVMFTKAEYANRAIRELNNYVIRPGRKIGVVASVNNCRLWIGQLPVEIDHEIVIKKFYEITDCVCKVAVYKYYNGLVRCALVSYKTHRAAAMARRILLPERGNLFLNAEISIDWAPPDVVLTNVILYNNYDHEKVQKNLALIKVEFSGERDANGQMRISKSAILNYSRRRRCQRRGSADDYLDNSIRNYLQENCNGLNANQRRCLETSVRSQQSGCTSPFPPRRNFNHVNQQRFFNSESRGQGCVKKNFHGNRSRSLELPPNYIANGNDLRYLSPNNYDVNLNVPTSKNYQGFPNAFVNFSGNENIDSAKLAISASGDKSDDAIAPDSNKNRTKEGSLDNLGSFNLFDNYDLLSTKKQEGGSKSEKSCDMSLRSGYWGSAANLFKSLKPGSDDDLRKFQSSQSNLANEKCENFHEIGSWDSTNSSIPKIVTTEPVENSSHGGLNEQTNFGIGPESPTTNQPKIMPDFRHLSPLINWNPNCSSYLNAAPRRIEGLEENQANSLRQENVGYRTLQQLSPANAYLQNCCGSSCEELSMQPSIINRVLSPEQMFVPRYQQQTHEVPQIDWMIVDTNFAIQRSANFSPQGSFSTSSFANYVREMPWMNSNNNLMLLVPRPILNRFAAADRK